MEDQVQQAPSKILSFPPLNSPSRIPDGSYVVVSNLIDQKPIEALALLVKEIAICKPPEFPQRCNASVSILGVECLTSIFERIQDSIEEDSISAFPKPAVLCFKEMFSILKKIRSLLEFCSNGSKIASLILIESVSFTFRSLAKELSDLLGLFPWGALPSVSNTKSLQEQMDLVKQGCNSTRVFIDEVDLKRRNEIVSEIEELERAIFPDRDRVEELFDRLGVKNFEDRVNEVKMLEEEIRMRGKSMEKKTSLIEFIRYCKYVFFGESWPRSGTYDRSPAVDWIFPVAFRCPITKAVMRNPVVVTSGQTYDRANIDGRIKAGNTTCLVTGESLSDTDMIPNKAMLGLIEKWSKEQNYFLKPSERATVRMTAAFLVEKLATSLPSVEATNRLVREIIVRVGSSSKLGTHIGEAGALPLLLHILHKDDEPDLQTNAMEAIHTLASLEPNNGEIMKAKGGIEAIIHVLTCGTASWTARGNVASTLYELSKVGGYKWRLSQEAELVDELVKMAREGPDWAMGKALGAVLGIGSEVVKEEEVERLVKACNRGEVEEVVKVVGVQPVPQLLNDMKTTWTKRKLRRKAILLLEICSRWASTWGRLSGPDF